MDWRKFVIALLCIVAAFVLFWKHIDGGAMFLTLIGGSPLAAEAGRKATAALTSSVTVSQDTQPADTAAGTVATPGA
jgi:hypothetical protein